jgi:c-di-GMP-binding flagellar brake protein YcgR
MRLEDSCTFYDRGRGFFIGVGAILYIDFKGAEGRLKSSVVGIELDKYLIIRTPRMTGTEIVLNEGDNLSVHYLCSGTVYGFQSTLLHQVQKPAPLIFLSWPELIESKDIREHHRIEAYLPATANIHGRECKGRIYDISLGGCRFTAAISAPAAETETLQAQVGEPILLTFELPSVSRPLQLSGETRNVAQDRTGTTWGVKFADPDADELRELLSHVKAEQQ